MTLAPIVLFTYNRLWHTTQTIEALQKNELASQSDLFIYSDGVKDNDSNSIIHELRKYLKTITGFKSITIIERDKNWGLADSIIDGVTEIVNKFGKIIVLEDDIITSPYFLKFMNNSLDFHENKSKVWHVSGWNYPIDPDSLPSTIAIPIMNCWGWGTWATNWKFFSKNPIAEYNLLIKNRSLQMKFDIDNSINNWKQIKLNHQNKINTWAIYWHATIFKNQGLCINPTISLTQNIGFDNSATNCKGDNPFKTIIFSKSIKNLEPHTQITTLALKRIKLLYIKSSLLTRAYNVIKNKIKILFK
jgi:GT2 family glycosyltransferase